MAERMVSQADLSGAVRRPIGIHTQLCFAWASKGIDRRQYNMIW